MNINDRLVERIDKALPLAEGTEDARVLEYIRTQLTPEGLEARGEEDQDVTHLHAVAKTRLRPYEREQPDV